ncbi:MAG: cation:proton antiporter, partial [Verrucomicrobia bacterium]|nr:cation:proton antiporter [Verrucomicrobiota bacterium]
AVGMLFDPQILLAQPLQFLAVLSIIVLGKAAAAFAIVVLLGQPISSALIVAASLAQIGEFSFILGELGTELHLLSSEGRTLIVAGALMSIALNTFLLKAVAVLCRRFEKHPQALA